MLLPLFGLFIAVAFFGTGGAIALRFAGVRPVRPSVLVTFIVAAQIGALTFAAAYGALFADAHNTLTSAGAVIGLLLGMPLAGLLAGFVAARWLAARQSR